MNGMQPVPLVQLASMLMRPREKAAALLCLWRQRSGWGGPVVLSGVPLSEEDVGVPPTLGLLRAEVKRGPTHLSHSALREEDIRALCPMNPDFRIHPLPHCVKSAVHPP